MSEATRPTVVELPPPQLLYQLAIGHYRSRALALVAKLGIAELIADERRTADELARTTRTDPDALQRVLRLLASVGVFDEDRHGRFGVTPAGSLLRADVAGSMKAMIATFAGPPIQDSWEELEYCVRTGRPAFKKYDPNAQWFSTFSTNPETAANFDKAMATGTAMLAGSVATSYDFSQFESVVDVGGGNGALLVGILKANSNLRGTLFERPGVIERARTTLSSDPLASRIDTVEGNFFEAVPPGKDAYLLKHVIHDWNDDDATSILEVCRKAMRAKAKLLVVEGVYPDRVEPSLEAQSATANDVNMLVCTGGRQRSEAEFRELYERSAFELTQIVRTPMGVCVIEGVAR